MALDPQDLLIFKVREEDTDSTLQKKKKPEQQTAAPVNTAKPTVIQKPQQQQQAQKQTVFQPPKPVQQTPPPIQQKPAAPAPQPVVEPKPAWQPPKPAEPKKSLWGSLTAYKPPTDLDDLVEEAQKAAAVPEAPPKDVPPPVKNTPEDRENRDLIEAAIDQRLDEDEEANPQPKIRVARKAKNARDSRKLAKQMDCSTHPWRRAYALCEYCGRPFCYEDIMEYGNAYYCLDDIDKVSFSIRNNEMVKYSRLSLISALLLVAAFGIYVYFDYSTAFAIFISIKTAGIMNFILNPSLNALIVIADVVLMVLSFVAAITIILESQFSFKLTTAIGLLTVALFSYQYLGNISKLYIAVIAACSFVSLVTLAYSRVAFDSVPDDGFASREVELSKSTGY